MTKRINQGFRLLGLEYTDASVAARKTRATNMILFHRKITINTHPSREQSDGN
jgi:hypothetical protein